LNIFNQIPCLTEQSTPLKGIDLQKKWFKSADKRIIGQYLQKFIDYNINYFNFLGVHPYVVGTELNSSLIFNSTEFIGAIPLRASDTGKQIGDLVVIPRFTGKNRFEEYIEILDLLDADINPQFLESIPLISGANYRPPLYLEAIKFISNLEQLVKTSWRKFSNIETIENYPIGQVNWTKYINNEFKVENRLKFQTRKNILSEIHTEYNEIRYVFDLAKKELLSSSTPVRIRVSLNARLMYLEEKFYLHKPKETNNIHIRSSDSIIVRNCKETANKILNYNFEDSIAWRVNFSDVFEKYVQYIFRETAKENGGKLNSNYKIYSRTSNYYSWELKHIEPDAIYQKDHLLVFIDAKYKSHLYNKYDISEKLKNDHRQDLHQIMSYMSFGQSDLKFGFLCYPSEKLDIKEISYKNNLNEVANSIFILGIPLQKSSITESKQLLSRILYKIESTSILNYK